MAGVMALSATSSYYDAQEIAVRILPNVVVLTIDPDRSLLLLLLLSITQLFLILSTLTDI